jgi:hypothetical protein
MTQDLTPRLHLGSATIHLAAVAPISLPGSAVAVELSLHLECLYCELVMRCSCPQCFKLLGTSQSMHQALDAIPCIVSSRLGSHYSGSNQADRIDVA